MPITIRITRGLLTSAGEREVFPRIARALLEAHGLEANPFMQENVIGHVIVSEPTAAYVGGKPQSLAIIEVTVPSVTFRERAAQQRFVAAATAVIDALQAGNHPQERTFVNVSYAVDGTWGIAGKAYTNDDLGSAIAAAFAR